MSKWKRVLILFLLLLFSFVLYAVFSICLYAGVDETREADVAIVLGAAVYGSEPSPVYMERINHAVLLYERGIVDKIIFTGGVAADNVRSDAAVAGAYALRQGVAADDIFLEELSSITEENLRYAKVIMVEEGFSTALIVSDPLHMKRAMFLASDVGISAYSSPTKTTRYLSLGTKIPFLARETFFYIGYLLYRIF